MSTFNTIELLNDLKVDVNNTLKQLKSMSVLPKDQLLKQPQPDKWSVAQVLEHLNGYNRFYLKEIEKAVKNNSPSFKEMFKSGVFGGYFTKMMQPKEGAVTNKMKAPKDYTYSNDLDVDEVLREFEEGQQRLLGLLDKVKELDLNKIKLPISISKMIKLKLGDVLRFLIAHQMRHFIQIDNTLKQV